MDHLLLKTIMNHKMVGRELADQYFAQAATCRWPQEALTANDICMALTIVQK